MKRHTCVECGQSPPAPSWHEVEDDQWVDTDCYRKRQARVLLADELAAARARADAAEMALAGLREAVQEVIRISDRRHAAWDHAKRLLAHPVPERGAALLAEVQALRGRESALIEVLGNVTRELQMWHETRPDPPGPLHDYCVTCGRINDAHELIAGTGDAGEA